MRGYYVPLVAGIVLTASTFLPWVTLGETTLRGIPNLPAIWVAGLGAIAAVLAALSLITVAQRIWHVRAALLGVT